MRKGRTENGIELNSLVILPDSGVRPIEGQQLKGSQLAGANLEPSCV